MASCSLTAEALQRLRGAGFHFTELRADGEFHRARPPHDAEWCVANHGATSTGRAWLSVSAGDFRKSGGAHTADFVWKSWVGKGFTLAERREVSTRQKAAKAAIDAALSLRQAQAQRRAYEVWAAATKRAPHAYLARKGLPCEQLNTGVWGAALLVPFYSNGELVTLERVLADGDKKALPGGRRAGAYHPLNYFGRGERVFITEGLATGAACMLAEGVRVVVAGYAANLRPVAEAIAADRAAERKAAATQAGEWVAGHLGLKLRGEHAERQAGLARTITENWPLQHPPPWRDYWPWLSADEAAQLDGALHGALTRFAPPEPLEIVIAADNDWATPGNPGVRQATEAAQAVGGALAIAPFGPGDVHPETGKPLTDWWDFYNVREGRQWASYCAA